jgi:phosphoribosylformylglycinamidine (FGAM) synthase PurS component
MLGRLDAQGEVIQQALASVHFAVARLRATAPVPFAASVRDIKETVARINRQTRAVEEAVTEVMTLRGGQ